MGNVIDTIGPLDILLDATTVALKFNGRIYNVRKLTLGDMAALQGSMKKDFRRPVTAEEVYGELSTPAGMTFVLWRRLKESDPDLTLEEMQDLIPNSADALRQMVTMLGIEFTEGNAENPLGVASK